MNRSRSIKKILAVSAVVVVVGALAVAAFVWHIARTAVDGSRARQAAALAKYHEAFLEDQRYAATFPIFARRSGDRDASLLIGPRVGWIVADQKTLDRYRESLPVDARGLELDETLSKRLGKEWLDADAALWAGLDFGWMSRLAEFDFWDLALHSPDPLLAGSPRGSVPDFTKLSAWAKLRLAKGIHEGAPASAIRETEQLARLCTTTEESGVVVIGIHILHLVDQVRERAAGTPAAAGKPIGTEGLDHLRRAVWGAVAHAELRTPAIYDSDWDQVVLGRCAALASGMVTALRVRPLLWDSYRAEYEHLGKLLATSPECRLVRPRRLWLQPDAQDLAASLEGASWLERLAIRWLPAARNLTGEILVSISEQNWFRQYQQVRGAE